MQSTPFVSVLMPVRNEAAFIRSSLAAVLEQDYPVDRLEVIVADGMSNDGTREIVANAVKQNKNLCMIDNAREIVATGLNLAVRRAKGEIIIRVDGHTIIAPDYVQKCVAALENSAADNVGGCMTAESAGLFGQAVAAATSSRFGVGGARFHYSNREEWVDTVYLGAWPRDVFQRAGMFDEEMIRNQDDEFNYRLRAAGGRILLSPEIKSRYYNRSTVWSLAKQYFQYGYWKVRVLQKHPRQMRPRQFVPFFFVVALLLLGITSPAFTLCRWALGAILLAYAPLNIFATMLAARKAQWRLLPVLPITFAIIHVSYGTGFLVGLIRFYRRWVPEPVKVIQTSLETPRS